MKPASMEAAQNDEELEETCDDLEADVAELRRQVEALALARAAAVPRPRGFAAGLATGCGAAIVLVVIGFFVLIASLRWEAVH
jgi:hypothetical protein